MAKRSFTYLHQGPHPPPHAYQTPDVERRGRIWQAMRGVKRPKVKDLDALLDELPPASQALVRGAVAAFSDLPAERDAQLREFFKGRLHPRYPLNERIALAFSEWIYRHATVPPYEQGLALDFCTLLALRLTKTSPSCGKRGYTRRVEPGPIRRAHACRRR